MDHSIYRILEFKVVGDHVLQVEFEDGLDRTIDFEAVLEGEMFGPLKDPRLKEESLSNNRLHGTAS